LRRLILALALVSCSRAPSHDDALRASLPFDNAYSRLRLESYAQWLELPEDWAGLAPSASLGRDAFLRYPLQPAPWGGSFTCSTCHMRGDAIGAPNDRLDVGAAIVEANPHAPPEARAIALSWGPGRVDVSTARGTEPAKIPDLRPVRFLSYLQHSGTVKQNDVTSLALRIETLIITSRDERARPPRVLARALAEFVHSLADDLPRDEPPAAFVEHCGDCHRGPGLSGGLVPVADVGTDPTLARSADRGTGHYRVPSLRGVSTRGALLHDGSIPDLATFLDPARDGGHGYGLDAPSSDRREILAFLQRM